MKTVGPQKNRSPATVVPPTASTPIALQQDLAIVKIHVAGQPSALEKLKAIDEQYDKSVQQLIEYQKKLHAGEWKQLPGWQATAKEADLGEAIRAQHFVLLRLLEARKTMRAPMRALGEPFPALANEARPSHKLIQRHKGWMLHAPTP